MGRLDKENPRGVIRQDGGLVIQFVVRKFKVPVLIAEHMINFCVYTTVGFPFVRSGKLKASGWDMKYIHVQNPVFELLNSIFIDSFVTFLSTSIKDDVKLTHDEPCLLAMDSMFVS